MEFIPIKKTLEENTDFLYHPDCMESLPMSVDYFNVVGYNPPWIGYFAWQEGQFVGAAGFKGQPVEGKVEIAYGTFERFRHQGVGAEICKLLVELSRETDPAVRITARTLPENNYSTRILEKNGFTKLGMVYDKDDGNVWEWEYGVK